MSCEAEITVQVGSFCLDARLMIDDGEVVAVLGPNGAGKTTLLRALAGFTAIDAGRITIDGQVLDDPNAGVFVSPRHRPTGMVRQDVALFPNLSVVDNVAFGLRSRRVSRAEARATALEWLERIDLAERADHRPSSLSGGQAQLVALVRTLATGARLVLLDEPMAALDVQHRAAMRTQIRRILRDAGAMSVLVTHDARDAAQVAHRVAVLEAGKIVQFATFAQLEAEPATDFVADIVATNRPVDPGSIGGGHDHG